MSNPKHPPIEKEVPEYAACLLMCGGPTILHKMMQDQNGPPITTIDYKDVCNAWYNSYVRVAYTGTFMGWWKRYKTWLGENQHGN